MIPARPAFRTLLPLLLALFALPACSTVRYAEGEEPVFIVADEFTPFFTTGPGQERGPDLALKRGARVEVLSRGLGYSMVRIDDGRSGHVANESLRPAPAAPPGPEPRKPRRVTGTRSSSTQADDDELPEALPDPNLPPEPVEVLHPLAEPELLSDEEPTYRF